MRHLIVSSCLLLASLLLIPVPVPGQGAKKARLPTVAEIQPLLEKAHAARKVPALAAAIVRGDGGSVVVAVGVRKRGTDIKVTAADQWHLGSNTKPMTALLIALLIESGLLDWDTPLARIFPEEARSWSADLKKITVAHLLTHISGVPENWPAEEEKLPEGSPAEQRAFIVKNLSKIKLENKPGAQYHYANLGYVVLGAIVDRVGKASWEEQLEKKIFRPLDIRSGGLGPVGKKDAVVQPWPHEEDGKPLSPNETWDNPPYMNPAARVHMSAADYNRFLAETLHLARGEKSLLRPTTAQKLFTNPHPVSRHSLSGWVGYRKQPGAAGLVLAHEGSNTFNYCTALLLVDKNVAISVFCNQAGPGEKACVETSFKLLGKHF
jgi:CubicO group peptidase (beta-lactamase class C family)